MLVVDSKAGCVDHDFHGRGHRLAYWANEVNHCPRCGTTHWHIGRVLAECASCSTALPLYRMAPRYGLAGNSADKQGRLHALLTNRAQVARWLAYSLGSHTLGRRARSRRPIFVQPPAAAAPEARACSEAAAD